MNQKPAYIIGFMVALAAVFGTLVTGLHLGSAAVLERNNAFLRQQSLVEVFGLGDPVALGPRQVADLVQRRVVPQTGVRDPLTGAEVDVLAAYADDAQETLLAYGLRFRGSGFWGPIEGILAVSPGFDRTVGLVITEQSETPGLGGRIEEPIFTDQFRRGIVAGPAEDDRSLRFAAPGTPDADGRQVDAITGATQTSMAMETILNENLGRFHRAMQARHGGN